MWAVYLGALVPTFFVSRILLYVLRKWPARYGKLIFVHVVSLLVTTLIGGIGMADGGALAAVQAFSVYVVPQAFWLAVDIWRYWRRGDIVIANQNPGLVDNAEKQD